MSPLDWCCIYFGHDLLGVSDEFVERCDAVAVVGCVMSACLNNNATDGHGCERFEGQRFFVGVVGSGHCTGESI